jgi:hypothetical protein
MQDLLRRGVCLPLFFDADCVLDGNTSFVVGPLDDAHERGWVLRLTGRLSIPCGKLVLLAGGGDGDELARAVSGKPPEPNYCIYQTIDVPPGDWRVDVLAYPGSTSLGLYHMDIEDDDELEAMYAHLPPVDEGYVVHLTPLTGELPLPELVEDIGWPGVFLPR